MTLSPTRRREAYLVCGIAALYLLLWLIMPKPAFWGLDNGFKFQGMKAFSETGRVVLPNYAAEFGISSKYRSIQPPFGLVVTDGQVPVFSALFMVLGGIFLKLFGDTGPFLLPLLGGWGVLLASWRLWLNQRKSHDARLFLLLVGLGSPLLFYSIALWEHSLATALLVYAMVLLFPAHSVGFKKNNIEGIFPAGVLVGLAVGLRTEAIIWALVIVVFWKGTGRQVSSMIRYIFGLVISLLVVAALNIWQTSVPYPLHIVSNLLARTPAGMMGLLITRMQNAYILILQGFPSNTLSIVCLIPVWLIVFKYDWHDEVDWGRYLAVSAGLAGLYFVYAFVTSPNMTAYTSESGGMIWVTPALAAALLPLKGERRKFWQVMWSGSVLTVFLLAAFSPAVKGIHWGPRHLLIIYPLLLMLASVRLQRWWARHNETKAVIVVLVTLSITNQAISYYMEYRTTTTNRDLNIWAGDLGDDFVFTRNWWLPGDCSLVSYKQPWFVVRKGESMLAVMKTLRSKDERKFHFIENQPYTTEASLIQLGIKTTAIDYFQSGKTVVKHSILEIISSPTIPEAASEPVRTPVSG